MSEARVLLKAKRQEARITHPYASYNASGQLKCSVCSAVVKHASAWEGHLGSKLHRTNIIRLREEEKRQLQQTNVSTEPEELSIKRKAPHEETEIQPEKRRRVESAGQGMQFLPQDFFSDSSQAPALLSHDSDEESEDDNQTVPQSQPAAPPPVSSDVDAEYERFQRELLSSDSNPSEAYDRATIAVEPVMASTDIPGFPPLSAETITQEPVQLSEEEVRLKREREDRELIMDRLLAEERAQEDADTRVQLLKAKLETLRNKRQAAKAHKKHSS
ncbi:hypothetical protein CPB84DRAFT_1814247 [Gymnopilus junonius]|uniref:Coiled-coil domain-containing protein 16 n=1 Tax=Gymnopilus junonius TaxID=109634 RepID=A0A9P5NTN8_GYMJU|nr:hypothetical protein CPB84DRAFT_1814247 [Gymnopilus junonius]